MRDGASRISELLRAAAGPGPGRGYYYQLLAAAGWTSLPLLPLVRQPTLILAGDDDPLTPLANARIMHRLIPRSELNIYHGGHLDLVSEPERMAAIVEAFLTAGTGPADRERGRPAGHPPRQATATPYAGR